MVGLIFNLKAKDLTSNAVFGSAHQAVGTKKYVPFLYLPRFAKPVTGPQCSINYVQADRAYPAPDPLLPTW